MTRIARIGLLCWLSLWGTMGSAHGQTPREVADLIGRIAAEREQIIQYVLRCKVDGKLGDLTMLNSQWIPENDAETEIYYEYSRIDQHYITAVRNLKKESDIWYLRGRSGSVGLSGRTGEKMGIRDLNSEAHRNFLRNDQRYSPLLSFDPMAIGLVFCGDFRTGFTLESQLAGMLDSPPGVHNSLDKDENGLLTWISNINTKMVFDTAKSYWPVALEYNRGEITWAIELGKYKDFDVPTSATLKCKVQKTGEYEVTKITFQWERINEPVSTGPDCVPRLGELFKML